MNLIRKALVPTALVAVLRLALGVMGRTSTVDASEPAHPGWGGNPFSFGDDYELLAPYPIAIWAVIEDDDTYTVEIDSESGSAILYAFLDGDDSGDLDNDPGATQEINALEVVDLATRMNGLSTT